MFTVTFTSTILTPSAIRFTHQVGRCYQIIQMLKTVKCNNNEKTLQIKIRAMEQLRSYLQLCNERFWVPEGNANVQIQNMLYSILPLVDELTTANGNTFAANISDRIIDTCNEAGLCHSKRTTLQKACIPSSLWALNFILSSGMFLGIAIINTGSAPFQFLLCFFGCVLIAISTLSIADLDNVSDGFIVLDKYPLDDIIIVVDQILKDTNQLSDDMLSQSKRGTSRKSFVNPADAGGKFLNVMSAIRLLKSRSKTDIYSKTKVGPTSEA